MFIISVIVPDPASHLTSRCIMYVYFDSTRSNIFRQWTICGKVPWAPVFHWAVIYHGITGYTSVNGPLAAVIRMIQKLVKMWFRGIRTRVLKKGLNGKAVCWYSTESHSYYTTETSLFWRCVFVHVGLYRFLNTPLVGRCPVIPWYITAHWSTGAQGTFPPMVHWRKMLDRVPAAIYYKNVTGHF